MAKTLEAILSAQETVTEALEDIQNELQETAAKAGVTAGAFATLSGAAAELDDGLDEVSGGQAMNNIADAATEATESASQVTEQVSDVNHTLDEFTDSASETREAMEELGESTRFFSEVSGETNIKIEEALDKYENAHGALSELHNQNLLSANSTRKLRRQMGNMGDTSKETLEGLLRQKDVLQDLNESFDAFDASGVFQQFDKMEEQAKITAAGFENIKQQLAEAGAAGETLEEGTRGAREQVAGLEKELGQAARMAQQLDKATEEVRQAEQNLGIVTEDTKEQLNQEAEQLLRAAQEGTDLAETKDVVRNANSQLAEAAGFTQEKLQEEAREMMETKLQASGLAESKEEAAKAAQELFGAASSAAEAVDEEGESLREAAFAAEGLEEMKDAVTGANRTLAAAAGGASELIAQESEELLRVMATSDSTEDALQHLARGEDELSRAAQLAMSKLDGLSEEERENAVTAILAAGATDELSDEFEELALRASVAGERIDEAGDELAEFGAESLAASLNIGPFNFALRRMGTQLPQLITLFGGLAGAIGGVTTAALGAAGAFGAIFGAGAFAMAQSIKQTNSNIKSTSEAMEKLMNQWKQMIQQAAQPLFNQQSVNMFRRLMEGVARAVRMASNAIVEIQGQLSQFQSNIGAIFFRNFDEVLNQLQKTVVAFLPWLERFTAWFMQHLPNALKFFRKQGLRVMPVIAKFGDTLTTALKAFSEFGVTFLKGILPALGSFLKVLTDVINVINALPDSLVASIIKFGALLFIVKSAIKFGEELAEKLKSVDSWAMNLAEDLGILQSETDEAAGEFKTLSERLEEFNQARRKRGSSDDSGILGTVAKSLAIRQAFKASGGASGLLGGVRALIARVGSLVVSIIPYFSTLSEVIAGVTATISAFVAGLSTIATAGLALLAIGAVIAMFKHLDAIIKGVTSTFAFLGDVLMTMVVPLWNALIEIVELILSPLMAIADGLVAVGKAMGQFGFVVDIFHALGGVVMFVAKVVGGLFRVIGGLADFLGGVLYTAIKAIFKIIAALINVIKGAILVTIKWLDSLTKIDEGIAQGIKGIFQFVHQVIRGVIDMWTGFIGWFERKVNAFIDFVNSAIDKYNAAVPSKAHISKIGDVDFSGGQSGGDFLKGAKIDRKAQDSMKEQDDKTIVKGDYKPKYNQYDLSNSKFNMRPEEKARVKGLIAEAIREANQQNRIQDGGI